MADWKVLAWNGAKIMAAIEVAQRFAIEETLPKAAAGARIEAPEDTGHLISTITWDLRGKVGRLIANAPYAFFVEVGTNDTPAQPFLRPAAEREFPNLGNRLKKRVREIR